jgi:hypothetical protein
MKTHAVDLDKTLAQHSDTAEYDPSKIGKPIPAMMERVKSWLDKGDKVVIFTARVHEPDAYPHIKKWLREQGLPDLEVTNKKRPDFDDFYDDRAVAVEPNTGKILGGGKEESWEDEARKELKMT